MPRPTPSRNADSHERTAAFGRHALATTALARQRLEPDARTMEDEPASTRVSLGTAPLADPQALGPKLSRQSIREALFPEVGAARVVVGRFELLRRLGQGGMGEVYLAYDEQLDRQVALKLLLPERSLDESARERLLREAQVLARLSHPNVVQIYEAGLHDDQVYLVMEPPSPSRSTGPRRASPPSSTRAPRCWVWAPR